jgi:hypothetical protein
MDRVLPGMTPADYHVPGSIRLNEAATAAYSRALAYWKSFRKKFDALPASDTGTTLTRDEWLLPLFDCLGYGRLQNKRAITIDSKDYPISHGWEDHVPIHLLSARLPLDKRTQNVSGAATRSPYSLVQELLNRSAKHRWGFVSNGLKLYVLRDNASLTRSANVEFDLESMMDGEYHADFTVLFLICHQSRLEIQPTPIVDNKSSSKKAAKPAKAKNNVSKVAEKLGKYELDFDDEASEETELDGDEEAVEIEEPTRLGPENCWLEAWTKLAGEQGTRAKERLRDGVQLAIQTLGAGFYTCSSNAVLHERLRSGELSTQDYYRQLLRLVYRLLMLMVAEDKRTESGQNLLHPIDTPAHIRDRYNQFYSVGRIRKLANERRGTLHRDLYESLKTTFLKLRDGYAPLGIPGIGSFLFSDTATPDLDTAQITNEALLDAFRNLCFTEDSTGRGGSVRRAVDFGNLGSEELGSIYESLLELHPEIDSQDGPFVLRTAAGNERKTSGSYYTPTSLINCLLDSALDPVVNQAIDVSDREEAKRRLLTLKVCDPACGSGHFLIAAANRMALHLARLETQDTEPTTLQIQHAKRQIIGRCIYGVDINEMAVELCKVSLWMEALEPGKPFSFLENHIKCGNSLLGATPRLLDEGIPDEAFNSIEGDDKEICSQLKKQNKRERIDHKSGQLSLFEPYYKLGNIADRFAKLSEAGDESLDAIADKQKLYEELIKGTPYLNARFWADTWCASFLWKKDDTDLGRLCPTERRFREIERNPHSASPLIKGEIQRLSEKYHFFHWHLAFPDVFGITELDDASVNSQSGWNNGFDLVLGNPPWEKMQFEERQFLESRGIKLKTTSAAERRAIIAIEEREGSQFYQDLCAAKAVVAKEDSFVRQSKRFPLTGMGQFNKYAIFFELALNLIRVKGRLGQIVKSGLATDYATKDVFWALIDEERLISLIDFENRENLFAGVAPPERFCVITAGGFGACKTPQFEFNLTNPSQIGEPNRRYTLTKRDIASINPNTKNCPVFKSKFDAEITRCIYLRFGVISADANNPKSRDNVFKQQFNVTHDAKLFRTETELSNKSGSRRIENSFVVNEQTFLPLIEPKFFQIYDHRFGTFDGIADSEKLGRKASTRRPNIDEKLDPGFVVTPRYWVSKSEFDERLDPDWNRDYFFVYRGITNISTNARTAIGTVIPAAPHSEASPAILFYGENKARSTVFFAANFSSFPFDYVCRQKIGGPNLNIFIVKQLPVVALNRFQVTIYFLELESFIFARAIELIYSSWDLKGFALDCEYNGPPFCWDDERRFQMRCELDAAYFHLYLGTQHDWGLVLLKNKNGGIDSQPPEMFPTPRDAVSYIMDTFPIVRRKDEAKYGEYRTKRVILEIYDQMTEIIEANEAIRAANPGKSDEKLRLLLRSYQSPLNPPPGPPTDANRNFIPYADWTDEIHRQYAGVIHPPKRSLVGLPKLELIRDLLLVLEAWNTPASISAIEPALILMRDDRARAILSGDRRSTQLNPVKREPVRIEGLQTVYLTLEANQTISKVGESGYRLAKPEVTAQFPDSIKVKARQAVAIVKSFAEPAEASTAVASECSFDFELAGESNG